MITALLLIFAPAATWERIFRARRGPMFIVLTYVLPLLVLASLCEGYGLHHWGKWQSEVVRLKRLTVGETVIFEVAQGFLLLALVFIGGKILKSMGETFHGRHTYAQAFRAVSYGLGPIFLFHILNAFPSFSPWISWGLGIVFTMGVMYQGVPRIMEPDPPHTFGLYFITSLLLLSISGLITFVTVFYLQGRFPQLEAFISRLAVRLPF